MKKETLKIIRITLSKLIPIISAYRETEPVSNELLTTIQVCIQNMCHEWESCHGYSHEEDVNKFNKYINFLEELRKSDFTYHFIDFVLNEVDICVRGNQMCEHEEDTMELHHYNQEYVFN